MTPLDHLERTFAESYRKEIDQEDNVWRTLPFFAAILAVQIGGLTQLREPILQVTGRLSWVVGSLGFIIGIATFVAVLFLARSIAPAESIYVAGEPSILEYVTELERAERDGELMGDDALTTFKRFLVRQYTATTDNNRAINRHRAEMRTIAGIATLVSVLATFILGAVTIAYQISHGS